ncbi:hypothetical protein GGS20DRAFT_593296 [Poronia punctata]|nr:hypothetical protein GGS20DRAFT_593296 [Poronia punctata]
MSSSSSSASLTNSDIPIEFPLRLPYRCPTNILPTPPDLPAQHHHHHYHRLPDFDKIELHGLGQLGERLCQHPENSATLTREYDERATVVMPSSDRYDSNVRIRVIYGTKVEVAEAENMLFVSSSLSTITTTSPGPLHVPALYAVYSQGEKIVIIMEQVKGRRLSEMPDLAWEREDPDKYVRMLHKSLECLRENIPRGEYYGRLGEQSFGYQTCYFPSTVSSSSSSSPTCTHHHDEEQRKKLGPC